MDKKWCAVMVVYALALLVSSAHAELAIKTYDVTITDDTVSDQIIKVCDPPSYYEQSGHCSTPTPAPPYASSDERSLSNPCGITTSSQWLKRYCQDFHWVWVTVPEANQSRQTEGDPVKVNWTLPLIFSDS